MSEGWAKQLVDLIDDETKAMLLGNKMTTKASFKAARDLMDSARIPDEIQIRMLTARVAELERIFEDANTERAIRRVQDNGHDLLVRESVAMAKKLVGAAALIDRLEGVLNLPLHGATDESCPCCSWTEYAAYPHSRDCPRVAALAAVKEWREGK